MRSLLLLLAVASAAPAFAQRGVERAKGTAVDGLRVALVIGNAGYGPSFGRLVNPTHDAEDKTAALKELGFSASSGQTADENVDQRDGLYTQELLKQLREPGLSVVEVFQRTREEVYSLSEERQTSEDWNRLVGTVVLKTGDGQRNDAAATPFTEPAPRINAEDEIWGLIGDSQMVVPKSETADFKAGQTFKDCADCPEMVVVPAGSFVMGSPANEQGHNTDEAPRHEVTIDRDFAVSKHEVTQGQFALFVRETSRNMEGCWQEKQYTPSDQHPLVCVSWEDAKAYAQWLATKTGKPYRLLSEAEWEYAARAGTTASRFWGNDAGKAACEYANVYWCGAKGTAQVGRVNNKPNAFGLHDMLGNAYEWVEDCYFDSYVRAPTDGSAWVSWSCDIRVLRGGSFLFSALDVRSANRYRVIPDVRFDFIGVRLARMLP